MRLLSWVQTNWQWQQLVPKDQQLESALDGKLNVTENPWRIVCIYGNSNVPLPGVHTLGDSLPVSGSARDTHLEVLVRNKLQNLT